MMDWFLELTAAGEAVPDIPRLYTALAEWLFSLTYVLLNKKRFSKPLTVLLSAGFLAAFVAWQRLCGIMPLYLWIPGMLIAIGMIYLFLFASSKEPPALCALCTLQAFITAEFAASLEWQLNYFIAERAEGFAGSFWQYFLLIVVYAVVFLAVYLLQRRYFTEVRKSKTERRDVLSAALIVVVIFAVSNLSFVSGNTPISARYAGEIFYVRTLVDFCGVILFVVLQEKKLWLTERKNVETMQKMLSYQYEQYRSSKESIDIINRKYHDLKHQIAVLKEETNPQRRAEYLDGMEEEIKMYEAQNKTGNAVLDSILTAKSLVCLQEDINFTCVADGSRMDFMEVVDICSIVGNALDNAIEYERGIEKDKRLIKAAIYLQGNLLILRFENYVEGKIDIENGLVVTTKADKENHGFGLKSMKYTAEKYGGMMNVEQQGEWFVLSFLLPVREKGKENAKTGFAP